MKTIIYLCILSSSAWALVNYDGFDFFEQDQTENIEIEINEKYGFDANNHVYTNVEVEPNQFLSEILTEKGFPFRIIAALEKSAEDIYSIRKIRAGKELTFVHLDSCSFPQCMIYEPTPFNYVRYHLDDELCVEVVELSLIHI